MDFEWDEAKARRNLEKHGVAFEEAATAFIDPRALELEDIAHSGPTEKRYWLLGRSALGRVLLVVFTERRRKSRGKETIRVISARRAGRKEKERYEEYEEEEEAQDGPNEPE